MLEDTEMEGKLSPFPFSPHIGVAVHLDFPDCFNFFFQN